MVAFTKPQNEPDFEDCFSVGNAYPGKSPRELAQMVVANTPLWFRMLFAIRQKIAGLFGLTTDNPEGHTPGVEFLLSLPVIQDDENAYEAGIADKHLDFTIRLSKETGKVHLQTQIWFNNIWGRIYLLAVLPFHNLIISHWLKMLSRTP